MTKPFSGSYSLQDVEFLLEVLEPHQVQIIQSTAEKEQLIQSGEHYSRFLSPETAPKARYLELFWAALEQNGARLAVDIWSLAQRILQMRSTDEIVLVSLARGGTPIGILLKRALEAMGRQVKHYSISIFRDLGVDFAALEQILQRGHAPESLVFVDGWSAKGVIARELEQSIKTFNQMHSSRIPTELCVVSDLTGSAGYAATAEDYLIPSVLLNAPVSGLISRSVRSRGRSSDHVHGCLYLQDLEPYDLSKPFLERIWQQMNVLDLGHFPSRIDFKQVQEKQRYTRGFLEYLRLERHVPYLHIKPGVGEATRTLLRRMPEVLLLQNQTHLAIQHLLHLAKQNSIPIEILPHMPFLACAIISQLSLGEI